MKKRKLASREAAPAHLRPTPISEWSEPEEDTRTDKEREQEENEAYEELVSALTEPPFDLVRGMMIHMVVPEKEVW